MFCSSPSTLFAIQAERRVLRGDKGGGGIEVLLEADVEWDGEGDDATVKRCGRRVGRVASSMLGRSVVTTLLTASCKSCTVVMGGYGTLGLGIATLPFSVGEVDIYSGYGERSTRLAGGEEGDGLVETRVPVSCGQGRLSL
jgi:hypothetical protein